MKQETKNMFQMMGETIQEFNRNCDKMFINLPKTESPKHLTDSEIVIKLDEIHKEEAARNCFKYIDSRNTFLAGAKWQQEKMYSEEEVYKLLCNIPNFFNMTIPQQIKARKEWFEQFKK